MSTEATVGREVVSGVFLRGDFKLWKQVKGLATTWVPLTEKETAVLAEKLEPPAPTVDMSMVPPLEWREKVMRTILMWSPESEVWVIWWRKIHKGRVLWMPMVPKQKAGMCSAEIVDWKEVKGKWESAGWYPMGSVHLHPGNGCGQSKTDEELFSGIPGCHMILGRDGSWNEFVSVPRYFWKTGTGKVEKDDAKTVVLYASERWSDPVNMLEKAAVTITYYSGGHQGALSYDGLDADTRRKYGGYYRLVDDENEYGWVGWREQDGKSEVICWADAIEKARKKQEKRERRKKKQSETGADGEIPNVAELYEMGLMFDEAIGHLMSETIWGGIECEMAQAITRAAKEIRRCLNG